MTGIHQHLLESCQLGTRDAVLGTTHLTQHVTRRQNCARCTDYGLPTDATVTGLNGFEFLARGQLGGLKARSAELAITKMGRRVADTAHVQAFHIERIEAPAKDEFRTAATDVDHQPHIGIIVQAMGYPEVDQARFFVATDDIDAMPEQVFCLGEKTRRVARLAQGIGADHAHCIGGQAAHPFAKLRETLQRACHGGGAQLIVWAKTGAQAHHMADPVDHAEMIANRMGNDHVKAVGTEIDRRDSRRRDVAHESITEIRGEVSAARLYWLGPSCIRGENHERRTDQTRDATRSVASSQ